MSLWVILAIIFVAGLVGGVINAIITDNGFFKPRRDTVKDQVIWRPGFLGNMLVGGAAAFLSFAMYGPLASRDLAALLRSGGTEAYGLPLSALGGAILLGITGARWLSNEVDKKMLRAAVSEGLAASTKPEDARTVLMAKPAAAWMIAAGKPPPSSSR